MPKLAKAMGMRSFFSFSFLAIFLLLSATVSASETKRLLILGDSLTDGFGLAAAQAFPALLEKKLKAKGLAIVVNNGGLSGATSAGALSRLKWHLRQKPDALVLALGANDGLRGIDLKTTEKNLNEVIVFAKKNDIAILLAGMRLPPNYGKKYPDAFQTMYLNLSRKHQVALMPFLLEGVAGNPALNLPDGIHPNEKGHQMIAEKILPYTLKLLKK